MAPEKRRPGDPYVSVRNFSKKFCRNLRRGIFYSMTDVAKSSLGVKPDTARIRRDEFWAVDAVSFELAKGESLGIIGANGSGKTTLLRMLAGIFPPDKGDAEISGKVSALLSLGVGFHPYMTVKENVYINGTILGMSRREIDEAFDFIIEFSGVKEFVKAPAGILSAGMNIRLGFSIAIAVKPDILLIDEVLSVGDKNFREKCINQIKANIGDSITIVVSHTMEMITGLCNRVMVMEKGKVAHEGGDVNSGIEYYHSIKN